MKFFCSRCKKNTENKEMKSIQIGFKKKIKTACSICGHVKKESTFYNQITRLGTPPRFK